MGVKFNRKPKSPYARHAKAPYRYSDQYMDWHDAVKRTGSMLSEAAIDAERRWVNMMRYRDGTFVGPEARV